MTRDYDVIAYTRDVTIFKVVAFIRKLGVGSTIRVDPLAFKHTL